MGGAGLYAAFRVFHHQGWRTTVACKLGVPGHFLPIEIALRGPLRVRALVRVR